MNDYYLGLDIGTNSCGIAAADEAYTLLRAHGKDLWAVRLFDEAKSQKDRRLARTARRRLERRKQRLRLLQSIFEEEVNKVDATFFMRLKYSALDAQDTQFLELDKYILFNDDKYTDKEFYDKFPTIYHLRKEIINNGTGDIRELFLAVKHLIKYRGHFLFEGQNFDSFLSLKEIFSRLNDTINACFDSDMPPFSVERLDEVNDYLQQGKEGVTKTEEKVSSFLKAEKLHKNIVKLFCGGSVTLKALFLKDGYADLEKNKIRFSDSDYLDYIENMKSSLTENEYDLIEACKVAYDYFMLAKVKKGRKYLCEAMVDIYDKHQYDLKLLKKFIKKYYSDKYFLIFRSVNEKNNYSNYVRMCSYKGVKTKVKKCESDKFFDFLKKIILSKRENAELQEYKYIIEECEKNTFLPKIINADNGIVPFQMNLEELKAILAAASKTFTFLNNQNEDGVNIDKILSLLTFRIPYFVGPVNGFHSSEKNGHAWIVRKESGEVTPWNFERKVNVEESAKNFIDKLISTCTYVRGEKVLPKKSVLYSKFNVLNQLNSLKINDEPLSLELKQRLFDELFMIKKQVSKKDIINFIVKTGFAQNAVAVNLGGITDREVTANMKSFILVTEKLGFQDEKIAEDIILWHTLFTYKKIVESFIKDKYKDNHAVMSKIKELKSLSFSDFGSLSRMFLEKTHPIDLETGQVFEDISIINLLYNTNLTLMEILNSYKYNFTASLDLLNGVQSDKITYDDIEQMYISPLVKRGVWQAVCMVNEYVDVLKQAPKKIFVEVARTNQDHNKKKATVSRLDRIKELYKNCASVTQEYNFLLDKLNKKEESDLRQDRLFLYFMQLGKCAYSGENIDLASLASDLYDIDHIVPQSMVKDDSLENKVLVKREENKFKSDAYPLSPALISKNLSYWKILNEKGLLSDSKLKRLTKTELRDSDLEGFISRQMVVVNQSAKAVCELLKKAYPNTKIVYSKAENVSDFRNKYGIVKCRAINDLHHAVDAYLNIVVGNVYHSRFGSDIRAYFKNKNDRQRLYNLKKIYDSDILNAWDCNKSLGVVKKTAFKNSMQVTRMPYTVKGGFYDQTVYTGDEAEYPLKGVDHYLSKTDKDGNYKYGGYKKLSNAYFMIVESTDKKGDKKITIEGVPVLYDYKIKGNEEGLVEMCKTYHKLENPKILLKKLKVQSLLKIDGTLCYLSYKSTSQIGLRGATEWFTDNVRQAYYKTLEKFIDLFDQGHIRKDVADLHEYAVSPSRDNAKKHMISKAQNLIEYDNIIEQLNKNCYFGLTGFKNVANQLKSQRDKYECLNLIDQSRLLIKAIVQLKCTAENTDLSLIGGSKVSGRLLINKNITDRNFAVIHKSITGVFEREFIVNRKG